MCGILGYVSSKKIADLDWINKALIKINHRGPDNSQVWKSIEEKVVFGHNRLSIIDLTNNANQPFESICKNFVITYNGEIYNYKELFGKLLKAGIKFKSNSDTEVLINSYKHFGFEFLNHIRGMFSFAIYDKDKNLVICSRDISGEKPFYYYYKNKELKFSSEIKSLLISNIEKKLDKDNLLEFFKFGFLSTDKTLVQNIKKIAPGEYLIFNLNDGSLIKKEYFNIKKKNLSFENQNFNTQSTKLLKLIETSVDRQMISDVPVSILLSGGIDSSLITALASRKHKINTFTFVSKNPAHQIELINSRIIAKNFSSNHIELTSPDCPETIFDNLMSFVDDPIFDSSLIPTFLITKEISKKYKVALSGDGGDELFGGYDHYKRLLILQQIQNYLPKKFFNFFSNWFFNFIPIGFRGRNWIKMLGKDIEKNYLEYSIFFDDFYLKSLLKKNILEELNLKNKIVKDTIFSKDIVYKSSLQDYSNFLREDILVKTDRCSMANSLEVRCPFLDYDLINFSFELKSKYKVSFWDSKIILKEISKNIFPKDYNNSSKLGFSIPIKNYLNQPQLNKTIKEILLDKDSFFNQSFVKSLMNNKIFSHNNYERIFGLVIFELWRKKYSINF